MSLLRRLLKSLLVCRGSKNSCFTDFFDFLDSLEQLRLSVSFTELSIFTLVFSAAVGAASLPVEMASFCVCVVMAFMESSVLVIEQGFKVCLESILFSLEISSAYTRIL